MFLVFLFILLGLHLVSYVHSTRDYKLLYYSSEHYNVQKEHGEGLQVLSIMKLDRNMSFIMTSTDSSMLKRDGNV